MSEMRCEYSDLPAGQCHHCDTSARPSTVVVTLGECERRTARPLPGYRYQSRQWQARHDLIVCDHPSDTHLCGDCADRFERLLGDVPAMWETVQQAIIKDTRFVQHGSRPDDPDRPDEAPVPVNMRAASDADQLASALHHPAGPSSNPVTMSRWWLASFKDRLLEPSVTDQAATISRAMRAVHVTVERPRDMVYRGQCAECAGQLVAEREDTDVWCGRCGRGHTVAELREAALAEGDQRWLTGRELFDALPDLTPALLRRWYSREGLATEQVARPVWRDGDLVMRWQDGHQLGDVRDRLARHREHADAARGITTHQAANLLGTSAKAIRRLVDRGVLVPLVPGARPLVFTAEQVERVRLARAS